MLSIVDRLTDSTITATDGRFGRVKDACFDAETWTIRYLVVDTESWLSGRQVLISPYAVKQPLGSVRDIDVAPTRGRIELSPPIENSPAYEEADPITRDCEERLHDACDRTDCRAWIGAVANRRARRCGTDCMHASRRRRHRDSRPRGIRNA